jgi:hypothetical protein
VTIRSRPAGSDARSRSNPAITITRASAVIPSSTYAPASITRATTGVVHDRQRLPFLHKPRDDEPRAHPLA